MVETFATRRWPLYLPVRELDVSAEMSIDKPGRSANLSLPKLSKTEGKCPPKNLAMGSNGHAELGWFVDLTLDQFANGGLAGVRDCSAESIGQRRSDAGDSNPRDQQYQ